VFRKDLRAGGEGNALFGCKIAIFTILVYPGRPAPSKHLLGVFPRRLLHFGHVFGVPVAPRWSETKQMKWGGNYHQTMCFASFSVRTSGARAPKVVGHRGGDV